MLGPVSGFHPSTLLKNLAALLRGPLPEDLPAPRSGAPLPSTSRRPSRVLPPFEQRVLDLAKEVMAHLVVPSFWAGPINFLRDKMVRMGMGEGKLSDGLSKLVEKYSDIRSNKELKKAVAECLGETAVPRQAVLEVFGEDTSWKAFFIDPEQEELMFRPDIARPGMEIVTNIEGAAKRTALWNFYKQSRDVRPMLPWYVSFGFKHLTLFKLAVWQITKRFVIAPTLEKAVKKVQRLAAKGIYATMDLVGESAKTVADATAKFNEYKDFLGKAAAGIIKIPRLSVSLKLTALTTDLLDPAKRVELKERMRVLLRLAVKAGARLTIDMEQYRYKDVTFELFKEILDEEEFQHCENLEIVVQAYLVDAQQDVASLLGWAEKRFEQFGVRTLIRLVKGAYTKSDPEEAAKLGLPRPLCKDQEATNENYFNVAKMILDKYHCVRMAIASHNPTTIFKALAYAMEKGIKKEDLEIQMLYGMASSPLLIALAKAGYKVAYYTPIGAMQKAIEYLARRMDENKNLKSCLVAIQEFFKGELSLEDLLFGKSVRAVA